MIATQEAYEFHTSLVFPRKFTPHNCTRDDNHQLLAQLCFLISKQS